MKTIKEYMDKYNMEPGGIILHESVKQVLREAMEDTIDTCAGVAYHELHDGASRTIACNQIRGLKEQIQ